MPGAELVYRFHAAVPDPETLVVVNCADLTRSIVIAEALESGKSNLALRPAGAAVEHAREAASRLTKRFAVHHIDWATLDRFQKEGESGLRSLYLTVIDLDSGLAYEAGHVPGPHFAIRSRLATGNCPVRAGSC